MTEVQQRRNALEKQLATFAAIGVDSATTPTAAAVRAL
jgi:hypothetical protein